MMIPKQKKQKISWLKKKKWFKLKWLIPTRGSGSHLFLMHKVFMDHHGHSPSFAYGGFDTTMAECRGLSCKRQQMASQV